MADECTDVTTIEVHSMFCRFIEAGQLVKLFLGIVPLKASDAKTIYFDLIKFIKDDNIKMSKLVGMGFDGAATLSGRHNGVPNLLKKNSPLT